MQKNAARRCLIVTTVLFSLGGLIGILPAMTSFFLFDAPGSEKNPATILLFICALTFPIICALSIAAAWTTFAMKRFQAACWLSLLPSLNLVGGVAALIWLEIFNGGQLS